MHLLFIFSPVQIGFLSSGLFFTILFLQSGLDKIQDYKGNLAYFKSHFANSILRPLVPILTFKITVLEIAAGISCLFGLIEYAYMGSSDWLLIGHVLSAISLLSLFLGQRLARDYAGAATIAAYFAVNILGFILLSL